MEKSVLLDKITKCNDLFNNVSGLCGCFDINEATQKKLDSISNKFDNTKYYVDNTNVKKETIDQLSDSCDKVSDECKVAITELNKLLARTLPGVIKGTDFLIIETVITKDTKGYSAEAKKLLTTKDGEKKLTKKAAAVLKKYQDGNGSSFTPEEINTFKLIGEMLVKAYQNDSKLDADDRLSPIPIDQSSEGKKINELLDKINAVAPNKKKSGNVKVVSQQQPAQAKKTNKGLKRVLAVIGIAGLATIIFFTARSCSKNRNNNRNNNIDNTPGTSQTDITTPEETSVPEENVIVLDLNDEKSVDEYAKYIQSELKKLNIDKTTDEIKNAVKLVNVDRLENKTIFNSHEDFTNAVTDAGLIANKFGSDAILITDGKDNLYITTRELNSMVDNVANGYNIDNLKLNKTSKGYRLFNVVDQLMVIIENEAGVYSNDDIQVACDLLNEITASKEITHKIAEDKNVGPDYLLEGMWLNQVEPLRKFTENKGNIYGMGQNIDGHSGGTCFNVMEYFFKPGNVDNALYQDFFVNKLVSNQAKSLKRN